MASGVILNDAMTDFSWEGRSGMFASLQPSKVNKMMEDSHK